MDGLQHKPENWCWTCERRLPDGAALRLSPCRKAVSCFACPRTPERRFAISDRTTGLKGCNIIAQGKGADRRPPPWVATRPAALGAATFLPPVEQTESVAMARTAFVREFGSQAAGE